MYQREGMLPWRLLRGDFGCSRPEISRLGRASLPNCSSVHCRGAVGPPTQQPRAMAETSARHLVVAHLHHQRRPHRTPFAGAHGSSGSAHRRLAGESGTAREPAQPLRGALRSRAGIEDVKPT